MVSALRRINGWLHALSDAADQLHPSLTMRVLSVLALGAVLAACGGRVRAGATTDAGAYDGGEDGASEEGGSTVVTLVSGDEACPINIVVDATSVYWTSNGGSVMKVPIDGGTPTTLASGPGTPWGIAVDATNVYWVDVGGLGDDGSVMKVPLAGGTPVVLASGQITNRAGSMAIDATRIYWSTDQGVAAMALAGGTPELIVSTETPKILGVDPTSVYWAGYTSGILEAPLDGGAMMTLAPGTVYAGTLRGTSLYYLVGPDVMTVPIAGGAPVTLASGNGPEGIAVDSTRVYWTDSLDIVADGGSVVEGRVMSVPLAGGTPTTLASALPSPNAIAVDATSVYWGDGNGVGTCSIKKLSPK
jgi:hypothetical protein